MLEYKKMKNLLEKFKGFNVCIRISGIIDTSIILERPRIEYNKTNIVFMTDEQHFSIDLNKFNDIKVTESQIELATDDLICFIEI